jgi:hypothetical protein
MSCLGPNYNPVPPREWYRYENQCAYSNVPINFQNGELYRLEVLKKGNVLQYKKNSANITKRQRYAQIARGMWTNRTTSWATQTESYTNPNVGSLKRVGYYNINTENPTPVLNLTGRGENAVNNSAFFSYQPINAPLTCPTLTNIKYPALPPTNSRYLTGPNSPPVIPSPQKNSSVGGSSPFPPVTSSVTTPKTNVIPDGGTLICNISENICTGEVYSVTSNQNCYPTSDSNVPGRIVSLCYNDGLPTYYPRQRRTFSAGGNKWPQNEKFIFSANSIVPINI